MSWELLSNKEAAVEQVTTLTNPHGKEKEDFIFVTAAMNIFKQDNPLH